MAFAIHNVTVDCRDAQRLARWWSDVFEAPVRAGTCPGEYVCTLGPGRPNLLFQEVPEDKVAKNRVHLDLRTDEDAISEIDRLVTAGATRIGEGADASGWAWTVLADPEGNEFCVAYRTPRA